MEETELLVLTKSNLEKTLRLFPEIAKEMTSIAQRRNKRNNMAINIAIKNTEKIDPEKYIYIYLYIYIYI